MQVRLNKFLSNAGICSRRKADELIQKGLIFVNNKKIITLGTKIDSENDKVVYKGKIIGQNKKIYYALNKPIGYVSTSYDKYATKKIIDLVPKNIKVYPVGRLDKNSEGLIILTNDGELAYKLTHPKFKHEKEYEVIVKPFSKNKLSDKFLEKISSIFKKGIRFNEGIARADEFKLINIDKTKNIAKINIILHQGYNKQIRRMFENVKMDVLSLKRLRIAKLKLENIKSGSYKVINKADII